MRPQRRIRQKWQCRHSTETVHVGRIGKIGNARDAHLHEFGKIGRTENHNVKTGKNGNASMPPKPCGSAESATYLHSTETEIRQNRQSRPREKSKIGRNGKITIAPPAITPGLQARKPRRPPPAAD
jgi:hypothetical protein